MQTGFETVYEPAAPPEAPVVVQPLFSLDDESVTLSEVETPRAQVPIVVPESYVVARSLHGPPTAYWSSACRSWPSGKSYWRIAKTQ